MRAAIRERTSTLGIEKSQVSADFIQARERAAVAGGSAAAANEQAAGSGDMFGGIDLSKITADGRNAAQPAGKQDWDEDMPTMFYDPDQELTAEEQQEVDPIMTKNILQQGWSELKNAKWPDFASAGREVVVMGVVVAFSALLIVGGDNLLRAVYTSAGFIPTPEELANYASRFDGLDLPDGWTDNMNENDMAALTDKVGGSDGTDLPGL